MTTYAVKVITQSSILYYKSYAFSPLNGCPIKTASEELSASASAIFCIALGRVRYNDLGESSRFNEIQITPE